MHPDLVYFELINKILKEGVVKGDRTGTGTISLFGPQVEFDLSEGFPLLTTKRLGFKTILRELLWFINGDTDLRSLIEKNVNIWTDDGYRYAKEKGFEGSKEEFIEYVKEYGFDLGPIYGHQWTSWEVDPSKVVKVPPRTKTRDDVIEYPLAPIEQPEIDENEYLVGKTFVSEKFGEYTVLRRVSSSKNNRKMYEIQFSVTGFKAVKRGRDIKRGSVRDLWAPTVFGKGYLGVIPKGEVELNLKRTWENMLSRCYNRNDRLYKLYGGSGVFVSKEWLSFENFKNDVKTLPNWNKKLKNLEGFNLDKDYFNSNCYSKETCVWLSRTENSLYRKDYFRPLRVSYENDLKSKVYLSRSALIKAEGVTEAELTSMLHGKKTRKRHGFTVEYINEDPNHFRYALPINQIQSVVDQIKANPDSRRLLVTAWNPSVLEDITLPSCHTMFQFYVTDGTLSCKMYQR